MGLQPGGKYFVTLLTRKRICCFGDVANDKLVLNGMGKTINDLWMKIPEHFENTWLDEYVVMPNHIHGIIVMKRLIVAKNDDVRNGNNGYVETRLIASLLSPKFSTDRFHVGVHEGEQKLFALHEVELKKGDMIYTVTDGFEDQLGSPPQSPQKGEGGIPFDGKKFKSMRLKEF